MNAPVPEVLILSVIIGIWLYIQHRPYFTLVALSVLATVFIEIMGGLAAFGGHTVSQRL